jgi:L-threonylcarbamoyladenylate synthase
LPCKLYTSSPEDLDLVSQLLIQGELAALPTETVYGLAANALHLEAVRQIFAVKGRPLIDPLIVHVLNLEQATKIAIFDARAEELAQVFWPGPLTMVLPRQAIVPDLITAGLSTVAIRSPAHPIFRSILERSDLALAAPSANPFGYISPTRAEHVINMLGDKLSHVVDGGACVHGVESTIVDLSQSKVCILRPGPIGPQALAAVLGEEVLFFKKTTIEKDEQKAQLASGMLHRHYSPRTPAHLVENFEMAKKGDACVYLKRPKSEIIDALRHVNIESYWLSESGEVQDMLHNLYDLLHRLDTKGNSNLWIEKPKAEQIHAEALLDRLTRACAK